MMDIMVSRVFRRNFQWWMHISLPNLQKMGMTTPIWMPIPVDRRTIRMECVPTHGNVSPLNSFLIWMVTKDWPIRTGKTLYSVLLLLPATMYLFPAEEKQSVILFQPTIMIKKVLSLIPILRNIVCVWIWTGNIKDWNSVWIFLLLILLPTG